MALPYPATSTGVNIARFITTCPWRYRRSKNISKPIIGCTDSTKRENTSERGPPIPNKEFNLHSSKSTKLRKPPVSPQRINAPRSLRRRRIRFCKPSSRRSRPPSCPRRRKPHALPAPVAHAHWRTPEAACATSWVVAPSSDPTRAGIVASWPGPGADGRTRTRCQRPPRPGRIHPRGGLPVGHTFVAQVFVAQVRRQVLEAQALERLGQGDGHDVDNL
jgi:hypothetical protein